MKRSAEQVTVQQQSQLLTPLQREKHRNAYTDLNLGGRTPPQTYHLSMSSLHSRPQKQESEIKIHHIGAAMYHM